MLKAGIANRNETSRQAALASRSGAMSGTEQLLGRAAS